jgi:hypothetical protein
MQKVTVYLPEDLRAALASAAQRRGVSLSRGIREAVARGVARRAPRSSLFESDKVLAHRTDELLAGFGDR